MGDDTPERNMPAQDPMSCCLTPFKPIKTEEEAPVSGDADEKETPRYDGHVVATCYPTVVPAAAASSCQDGDLATQRTVKQEDNTTARSSAQGERQPRLGAGVDQGCRRLEPEFDVEVPRCVDLGVPSEGVAVEPTIKAEAEVPQQAEAQQQAEAEVPQQAEAQQQLPEEEEEEEQEEDASNMAGSKHGSTFEVRQEGNTTSRSLPQGERQPRVELGAGGDQGRRRRLEPEFEVEAPLREDVEAPLRDDVEALPRDAVQAPPRDAVEAPPRDDEGVAVRRVVLNG
ncbi:hypothetical protein V8C86DRAFT_2656555 [Haematococcus lacustris]